MGSSASKLPRILDVLLWRSSRERARRIGAPVPPKGYVPVCVGLGDESKRFMIHTSSLGDAPFLELLRISAQEYGFKNQGVLRIPYDTKSFEERMLVRNGHTMPKVITV